MLNRSAGGVETVRSHVFSYGFPKYIFEQTQGIFASFILAMALYSHVQEKAQVEIDRVLGSDRLPTFEDRPSMPYVEAVYREVMRWRPIVPLGFPRYSTSDDIYKGFYIPKGGLGPFVKCCVLKLF